ncbi:hypothetical protein DPMN_073945 [Dreissena polymorpha]|uniref:Uncharacterized protein n=1 Tax=Dreissena polymorpha TaxID=45954 RepID=A0A9D3YEA7_DREPO|nr:hypothetical protein DPMN_073945 [Dreissena polymorpha]
MLSQIGDDVKNVQRKIDDIQTRYGELSDKLTDILEQMEEALPLAKNFNETHAKFIDWLVKMEPKTKQQEGNESEDQVSVSDNLLLTNFNWF